jgi:hypothetical protein
MKVAGPSGFDPFRMRMAKLPAKVLEDPNLMIDASSVGLLVLTLAVVRSGVRSVARRTEARQFRACWRW